MTICALVGSCHLQRFRWSQRRCFMKKGALKNFKICTGNCLCKSLFLNKVTGLSSATLLKKRLWHKCFPENFAKLIRTPILKKICDRLLMEVLQNNRPKILFKIFGKIPKYFEEIHSFYSDHTKSEAIL